MTANKKVFVLRISTLLVLFLCVISVFYIKKSDITDKTQAPYPDIQKFLNKNQPDSAITALRFLLTKDISNPAIYCLLAQAYLQKDELYLARNYCLRSLELNPLQSQAKSILAQTDFNLAEKCWQNDKKQSLFYLNSVLSNTNDEDLIIKVAQLTGGAYKIEQLTNDIFADGGPSFSPDNKQIIYHSDTSFFSEEYPLTKKIVKQSKLFILDLTQNKKTCLTQSGNSESFGRFSPDGENIVFQREVPSLLDSEDILNFRQDLVSRNLKTGQEKKLTSDKGYEGLVCFFPNENKICYVKDYEICVMDLATNKSKNIYSSGENFLTKTKVQSLLRPISPFHPNVSPDGKKIVFQAGFERIQIYIMDLANFNTVCLSHGEEDEIYPSFSPDGKKILFISNGELWLMNTDGKNKIRLTDDRTEKKDPAFSPDGKKIIFCAKPRERENRYFEIYVLRLDKTISKSELNRRLKRIEEML